MSSEEPPPAADNDPTLTVPPPSESESHATAALAAAGVPEDPIPAEPVVHANPPQSDTPNTAPPPAEETNSVILSPIPKKSNISSDQITQSPASSQLDSSSLNLPDGVILPPTVTPALINKVTGSLKIAFFSVG